MKNKSVFNFIFKLSLIIFIIFFSYITCFKSSISYYDESWCFQNTYKMLCGLNLYKDINIIITPLYYILGFFFLKIFRNTIITFRLYTLILCFSVYLLSFLILRKNKISCHNSLLYIIFIFVFTNKYFFKGGATYNILALIFALIGILLFLHNKDSKYYHYIQGFIVFLCFFSKQTIGVLFGVGILIYEFIYSRKNFIKNNFKKFITFIICVLSFCIYLIKNDLLFYFIDLAFLGLSNFLSNFGVEYDALLLVIVLITIIFKNEIYKKVLDLQYKSNIDFMICVGTMMIFLVYPILNSGHIAFAIVVPFLTFFSLIDRYLISEIIPSNKIIIIKIIILISILLLLITCILNSTIIKSHNIEYINDSKIYKNIPLEKEVYNDVMELNKYISLEKQKGNNVIILSYESALVNIYRKEFHGNKDMIFYGNLGKNGISDIIDDIKQSTNVKYLVKKSEDEYFWQEVVEVFDFVKNNLSKDGEILDYEIFSNNIN